MKLIMMMPLMPLYPPLRLPLEAPSKGSQRFPLSP